MKTESLPCTGVAAHRCQEVDRLLNGERWRCQYSLQRAGSFRLPVLAPVVRSGNGVLARQDWTYRRCSNGYVAASQAGTCCGSGLAAQTWMKHGWLCASPGVSPQGTRESVKVAQGAVLRCAETRAVG